MFEEIVIPEIKDDVVVKDNKLEETFNIKALLNAIIAFLNNLLKFEF